LGGCTTSAGEGMLDKTKIAWINDALGEVERANQRGSFAHEVLKVSKVLKLGQTLDWLLSADR
jgi:hypothetical protein